MKTPVNTAGVQQQHTVNGNPGEVEKKSINPELWQACAGPLVNLPAAGTHVVYFPQGHSEQVAASMKKDVDAQIPNYPNLPSKLVCLLHNITLHADPETDEVYAQMTLQPVPSFDKEALLRSDLSMKANKPQTEFFCKTLTASDTSTHGGFSVPRRSAEKIFPPLDYSMQPPAQELVARDLHDNLWTFRHIYRGQPKRHLLTTGWSLFVSGKRLFAGDSVLFIRDEKQQLLLGIRRANRQPTNLSSSVLSSDSMHIGILAAAAHAAANNSPFTVFYNPRASPSEFVIPLAKYYKATYSSQVSLGMRFRMMFETEESGTRRYMGTITGISDLDPVRWKNSQWRNLQVGWDESTAGERRNRVSIWEIEPVTAPFFICPTPPFFRSKRPRLPGMPDDDCSDLDGLFKRTMPWLGDDFGMKDPQGLPGLSLVQWMNMQQNPSLANSMQPNYLHSLSGSVLQNVGGGADLSRQLCLPAPQLPQQNTLQFGSQRPTQQVQQLDQLQKIPTTTLSPAGSIMQPQQQLSDISQQPRQNLINQSVPTNHVQALSHSTLLSPMAHDSDLPCDGDGVCMACKVKPSENESLICKTCATPWHVSCLSTPPDSMGDAVNWECPDCSMPPAAVVVSVKQNAVATSSSEGRGDLIAAIRVIESDSTLTEQEKAQKRQDLMSGSSKDEDVAVEGANQDKDVLNILDGSLNCSMCMQLPERPVTTPCGHNFCLKCFQKWVGQRKSTCANCRTPIPAKMASQPRINSALVIAIRMARMMRSGASSGSSKVSHFVHNQNRPDKAFTTERAKKTGKANACSGKIFVTIPGDHFGPITAENDPERNVGVMVGETWEDRFECRQWGAHFPHVAGIAGQSDYGAQSVALSGGYEDDEDHGEWFLYTGSGGRDLSGNKRTNKLQSFDQKFEKLNEALRVSCLKGYPVRVVRSHKEKRSSYAPDKGVRYDGVYRIEKCWRKPGKQGFKVCRYLFVRCDNDPAPWTSDEQGDRPRALPAIKELKGATDMTERKGSPAWDYDEEKSCWMWKKAPPPSRKPVQCENEDGTKVRQVRPKRLTMSVKQRLLKEFTCHLCREVMNNPLTTPCAHNFCKACLDGAFAGQSFTRQRTCEGRRTLRAQKNIMKCPSCPTDISDFLQNPQINRELMNVIDSLKRQIEEENAALSADVDDGSLDGNEILAETDKSMEDDEEGAQPVNETEAKQTNKRKRSGSIDNASSPKKSIDKSDAVHNLEEVDPAHT